MMDKQKCSTLTTLPAVVRYLYLHLYSTASAHMKFSKEQRERTNVKLREDIDFSPSTRGGEWRERTLLDVDSYYRNTYRRGAPISADRCVSRDQAPSWIRSCILSPSLLQLNHLQSTFKHERAILNLKRLHDVAARVVLTFRRLQLMWSSLCSRRTRQGTFHRQRNLLYYSLL